MLLRRILQPIRVVVILSTMIFFVVHMCVVWLFIRRRWKRVLWANRTLENYAAFGLWVLNVKVRPVGIEKARAAGSALYVGNHLSYIDVLVFSSNMPACFVTSMEIKEAPVLGQVCTMAGCLFVERRNKMNIHREVAEMSEGLAAGCNVAIFPEATSTNGEQILRFRRPLYVSAIDSGRPVIPFCLNYHTVGGKPIDTRLRDTVFWYGDMDFVPHLWALAGNGGTLVDLIFLEPIPTSEGDDPTELAARSQAAVESVFKPVRPDSNAAGAPKTVPGHS
jgi:1-acyl-sn-glycerol-3-phosphate acyltransferase